jgi:hypothetical protein
LSGDVLLAALLCTALALALSFAPHRALLPSFGLLIVFAAIGTFLCETLQQPAMIGSAVSILATALAIHLKVLLPTALLLAANAGLWCGALTAGSSGQYPLLTLPLALLAFPGRWIVAREWSIVLKIVSGWLVAVGLLTTVLPMITTPGYAPDHKE